MKANPIEVYCDDNQIVITQPSVREQQFVWITADQAAMVCDWIMKLAASLKTPD
jgi:hypothetical protein